jgi:uncharacterized protein
MTDKLILGSANFGLKYGVANRRKLSKEDVFEILETAASIGMGGIDTARAYGDSEKVIGEFFKKRGKVFKVITKLPQKEYRSSKDVEVEILESLNNLNIPSVDVVLFHSYEAFKHYGKIILSVLKSFCKDKIIGRYGISVYHRYEVDDFLAKVDDTIAIEFPMNLFDHRFLKKDYLKKLKSNGNVLIARSIFLQGLFFLDKEKLKKDFTQAENKVMKIREVSKTYHIRPECMALLYVLSKAYIDGVVIGVDGKDHLMSNVRCLDAGSRGIFNQLESSMSEFEVTDEDLLLPYKWKV